ncbi:hypothetical protein JCM21738_2000 [Mesobacillus boroniphilus JCM 21738]|uniref:Uncharacterized protein n=1 Tax=Mesobacillus boroniphilus JCM 21738 TaxID=1294265 RepID=W4RLA9_9BACI|nr:hypothetical protein JCM21738_2000 [Mesobacillus boroniphilus JCM 21738]
MVYWMHKRIIGWLSVLGDILFLQKLQRRQYYGQKLINPFHPADVNRLPESEGVSFAESCTV